MLDLRPSCEHCTTPLPADSTEAMICTFECTFCSNCVVDLFENVCPNCGGGFEKRPIRPKSMLEKYPASQTVVHKPVDLDSLNPKKEQLKDVPPENR